MALLEVNNLSKHFGGLKANDGLNLKVEKGEIRQDKGEGKGRLRPSGLSWTYTGMTAP